MVKVGCSSVTYCSSDKYSQVKLGGNKTTLIYCRSFFSRRDEDRTILLELKTRGASRETFAALSDKLNKPSSQVTTHVCLSYTLLQKK